MGVVHANYVEVYTLDDWTKEPRMFSLGFVGKRKERRKEGKEERRVIDVVENQPFDHPFLPFPFPFSLSFPLFFFNSVKACFPPPSLRR